MTPLQEIDEFADLRLDVEVQLDRKPLTLREMLQLDTDSVIRLPRAAGENIDAVQQASSGVDLGEGYARIAVDHYFQIDGTPARNVSDGLDRAHEEASLIKRMPDV